MMTLAQTFIEYASWYIGRKEKSGNSGFQDPNFEKEMKGAGWYPGAAWCAFFIKMVFRKLFTGDLLAKVNRQFNGSAKQTFDNVVKAGTFATGTVPEEGAICVWLQGYGPSGHIGVVTAVDLKRNTMVCVEGNTNTAGSREGVEVAKKPRTIERPFNPKGLNVYGYIYARLKV